tara:strand:+ start:746 stop:1042 length:297 start_codon:yes stop_codon:yes gene_type:complete
MGTKRVSLTMDENVLTDVDYLCSRLSVSRSVFITEVLRQSVSPLRELLEIALPGENTTDGPRARDPDIVRQLLSDFVTQKFTEFQTTFDLEDLDNGKH